jgi:hypothetical protein
MGAQSMAKRGVSITIHAAILSLSNFSVAADGIPVSNVTSPANLIRQNSGRPIDLTSVPCSAALVDMS